MSYWTDIETIESNDLTTCLRTYIALHVMQAADVYLSDEEHLGIGPWYLRFCKHVAAFLKGDFDDKIKNSNMNLSLDFNTQTNLIRIFDDFNRFELEINLNDFDRNSVWD